MYEGLIGLISQGGWVMWPLLVLSVVSVMLIFERCWFWLMTNGVWRVAKLDRVAECLSRGDVDVARELIANDRSVYGRMLRRVIDEKASDGVFVLAVESERGTMERFMPTLGTVITAAPMLGILGTVMGIIASFDVLSESGIITDPSAVGAGVGEALLTTAVGLVIALVVLFPYNAFKAQIDRTLSRMETLIAVMGDAGK